MTKPLVSVVIPVYNMEEFLEETLDSVLSSDYPNFEVIVMDDGSKDRSLEIAESYKSRYENVRVYTQVNSGVIMLFLKQVEYIFYRSMLIIVLVKN